MRLLLLTSAAVLALAACDNPASPDSGPVVSAPAPLPAITVDQIEAALPAVGADPDGASTEATSELPPQADPGLIRLQILLDRSAFSPGVIDGLAGENTRQALAAWRNANAVADDLTDAQVVEALVSADAGRVMASYALTAADIAGPFSPPAAADLKLQASQGVNYTSARERLAERFHITEDLLQALNPGVDFRQAGQDIVVPAVSDAPLGEVHRIVIDKTEKSARAFDREGRLLAFYPATIGSNERPAPSGALTVIGVAPEPDYTYDPDRLSYDRGDEKVVVPAGPNNPVGSVWIELSRDSYGIHGSPDPSRIAKTASNGCIRLTNWDAEQLAAAVKPGVRVEFT